MGNCSSEHQHQSRLFRGENFTNDPSAFRVFVKKRNKFIPGWLKINDDEILFSRGGNNFQFWPLAHLRRYGYTCSGVFFFESGRRCATGEGLHTFQSHQAERIFHMVQSKIKIEEYARCGSRAASVASSGTHRVHSLVPNAGGSARIHPIQRFSSEGAANNEFAPASADSVVPPSSAPPPPYSAYAVTASDARRMRQNGSPNSNCPSVVSALSSSMIPQHFVRSAGGPMADPPALSRDRPRSVVSNIEHGVVLHQRLPHSTTAAGLSQHYHHHPQAVTATQPPPPPSSSSSLFHHRRPPPQNVISSNSTSSLMTVAAMLQQQQQQQHGHQQNGGFALPPSALNALAVSASGSCLMNQSFHSVLDSTGGGSPWASQQQLEGEIVLEHVLGVDSRRRLTPSKGCGGHSPNAAVAEPIRVAVPPPRQQQQQPMHMKQLNHSSSSSVLPSSSSVAPPPPTPRYCCDGGDESTVAYVNVDFGIDSRHVTGHGNGISPQEMAKHQQLNVRELHRTDHSRMEFLSTGPGAFMLSSSYGPMSMSTSMVASASSHADAMTTALPPALLHQHHPYHHNAQQQCMHHSFYAPRGPPSAAAFHHQQMSASFCGILPTDDQPTHHQQKNNENAEGIGRCETTAQSHHPNGPSNLFTPIKMASPQIGPVQQQSNPPLSNTTTASSTPSQI